MATFDEKKFRAQMQKFSFSNKIYTDQLSYLLGSPKIFFIVSPHFVSIFKIHLGGVNFLPPPKAPKFQNLAIFAGVALRIRSQESGALALQ